MDDDDDDEEDTSLAGVNGDDTSLAGVPIPTSAIMTNNDDASDAESNHNSVDHLLWFDRIPTKKSLV